MTIELKYGDEVVINMIDNNIPRVGESISVKGERYTVQEVEYVLEEETLTISYLKKVILKLSRIPKISEIS